jgi:hypothetical protein
MRVSPLRAQGAAHEWGHKLYAQLANRLLAVARGGTEQEGVPLFVRTLAASAICLGLPASGKVKRSPHLRRQDVNPT